MKMFSPFVDTDSLSPPAETQSDREPRFVPTGKDRAISLSGLGKSGMEKKCREKEADGGG